MTSPAATELAQALRLARIDPGTPTPSAATEGMDSDEMGELFRRALLAVTAERDELRRERDEARKTDGDCPCWTSSHCRHHDAKSPWHAPCCPVQVHNDRLKLTRLSAHRDRLAAALREACDITDELGYGHAEIPAARRIAALRALAEGGE